MESGNELSNLKTIGDNNSTFLPLSPFSFPHDSNSFSDSSPVESRGNMKSLEGVSHHIRCSSESILIEDQPSWLDDLLNDSETVFHRGHRRSASDSYAYLGEAAAAFNVGDESEFVNAFFGSSARSQKLVHYKAEDNNSTETKGDSVAQKNDQESKEEVSTSAVENRNQESSTQNLEVSADKAGGSQAKNSGSKTDAKRSKQHNAHRSRVRKLQCIAHLERTVQILKAEGSEVSAELEFIEQQNIILTMENRALRQRLESLSQQVIKHWEQGMLEREIGRLQSLFHLQKQQQMQMHHQQQQQQLPHNQHPKHRRNRSKDLDHQVNNNTSMKNKDATSSKLPVNGPIRV